MKSHRVEIYARIALIGAITVLIGALFGAKSAEAGEVNWSIGIGLPGMVMAPPGPPVYYEPPRVYVPAEPGYYAPAAPIYYRAPPPVYDMPEPAYRAYPPYPPAYRAHYGAPQDTYREEFRPSREGRFQHHHRDEDDGDRRQD